MKKILIKVIPVILFLVHVPGLQAQINRCALNLAEAREKFMAGQIQEVPPLLVDCIEDGFSYEDRIEAYKLLINAYIFDDNIELADKYMLDFLDEFPDYEASPDDPFEFVSLFELYDNSPRFSIGGYLGTNLTMVDVTEPFGVYDLNETAGEYKIAPGFNMGGHINFFLGKKIELSLEPMVSVRNIKYEVNPFSFTRTEYKERQGRAELPVSLVFKLNDKGVSPYLRMGVTPSYMIGGSAESSRYYLDTGTTGFENLSSGSIKIDDQRSTLNFSVFLGAGIRYQLSKSYLFADVRYNYGLTGMVDPVSRQNLNDDNTWLFYNTQDDFYLNDLMITIGYTIVFYKPKKIN